MLRVLAAGWVASALVCTGPVRRRTALASSHGFAELVPGLSDALLASLAERGITEPSPIQLGSLPVL